MTKKKSQQKSICTVINRFLLFKDLFVRYTLGISVKWLLESLFIKPVIIRENLKGKSELAVLKKKEGKSEKRPWLESIRCWWKGIQEICMNEIILNPKSLQISCLILTDSSEVIAVGERTMCLHSYSVQVFLHKDQESTIQMILWIFCWLASKQEALQSFHLQETSGQPISD